MIPTYDQFIETVLRFLAAYPEGVEATVVYEVRAPDHRDHLDRSIVITQIGPS